MSTNLGKMKKNITSSVMLNIFNIGISFMGRIVFLRILDVYYLGINGLFTNILGILSLADMGLATAMMYSMYDPIDKGDNKKIAALVAFFKKIYLGIAGVVFVIGISLMPFIKHIINMDKEIPYIHLYYFLSLMSVVITYLFIYRTILLNADQKQYVLNRIQFKYKIVTFFVQLFVLVAFKNYALYMLTAIITSLASNFAQNRKAMELYPYLNKEATSLEKHEKAEIADNVKSLFIYKFCGTLQENIDNILISMYVGTVYVGFYSNYLLITLQVTAVISIIFTSIKATVGNVVAQNIESSKKAEMFWNIEKYNYWLIGFSSVSLYILLQDFISIVFGIEYLLNNITVVIIVALFYTKNIRQTIWTFRETTGIFKRTKYVSLVSTLLNLIFSIILGRIYGLPGILVASIIAIMLCTWWIEPVILFKEIFKENVSKYFIQYILKVLAFVLILMVTNGAANIEISNNVIIQFIYKMLCCSILTNIMFGILVIRKKDIIALRKK